MMEELTVDLRLAVGESIWMVTRMGESCSVSSWRLRSSSQVKVTFGTGILRSLVFLEFDILMR